MLQVSTAIVKFFITLITNLSTIVFVYFVFTTDFTINILFIIVIIVLLLKYNDFQLIFKDTTVDSVRIILTMCLVCEISQSC